MLEQQIYNTSQQLIMQYGLDKIYITTQRFRISQGDYYEPDYVANGSYNLLIDTYGFNPIFGVVVHRDCTLEQFYDMATLMPLDEFQQGFVYFINPQTVYSAEEIYSTRWGDYHEIFSEYCEDYYLNLNNLQEVLSVAKSYTNEPYLYEMDNVDQYLNTPRFNSQKDMVLFNMIEPNNLMEVISF